jgi:hypothetical protein
MLNSAATIPRPDQRHDRKGVVTDRAIESAIPAGGDGILVRQSSRHNILLYYCGFPIA